MNKLIYLTLFFLITISSTAIAQLEIPALSTSAEIKQTVGLTDISIQYSRPSARGRTIFGTDGLIPYNKLWRTGANSATKITFSDDVNIGNQGIKKGSYAILTKPGSSNWEVHFYPYEGRRWSTYVEQTPVATITAQSTTVSPAIETFTISITDIAMDQANLVLAWEKTQVSLPIQLEVKERVMASIEKTMSGPSTNDYYQAALFLQQTGTDLKKALQYIQKATKVEKPRFFQVYREALILADLNRNTEAIAVAKKSKALSEEAKNQDFVRLNEKLIARLSK